MAVSLCTPETIISSGTYLGVVCGTVAQIAYEGKSSDGFAPL